MSLLDRARRALAGLTGDRPASAPKDERAGSDRGGGSDGGKARSTAEAASAPNPSVAAEEVD